MDAGAKKKEARMKQMKSDCYKSVLDLEDIKKISLQKIDEIFSKFQMDCLQDWRQLNDLVTFSEVRESSLSLEQKVTRLEHFFTDLPVLMEEQIEFACQKKNGKTFSDEKKEEESYDRKSFVNMVDLLNLLGDATTVEQSSSNPRSSSPRKKRETKPKKPPTEPERATTETASGHAEQHSVESSSYVKPSPPIFIYDTGPSLPSLFQISEECEFSARICYSQGPQLFYIQKKEYAQSIGSMTTQLTNAMDRVENHRGVSRNDIPCISITFSLEWQNYFRAYIRKNVAGNRVEVYYIDWGNVEVVPLNYCFELLPQFLNHPAYAIPCSLSPGEDEEAFLFSSNTPKARDVTMIWPDSAGAFFQKNFTERTVLVKVLSSKESQVVKDYDKIIYETIVFLKDKNVFRELRLNKIIPQIQTK